MKIGLLVCVRILGNMDGECYGRFSKMSVGDEEVVSNLVVSVVR